MSMKLYIQGVSVGIADTPTHCTHSWYMFCTIVAPSQVSQFHWCSKRSGGSTGIVFTLLYTEKKCQSSQCWANSALPQISSRVHELGYHSKSITEGKFTLSNFENALLHLYMLNWKSRHSLWVIRNTMWSKWPHLTISATIKAIVDEMYVNYVSKEQHLFTQVKKTSWFNHTWYATICVYHHWHALNTKS